jgi:hypothetical protein
MNRANQSKSKLYDGKPLFTAILSGNGYFRQWQTFQHQCSCDALSKRVHRLANCFASQV